MPDNEESRHHKRKFWEEIEHSLAPLILRKQRNDWRYLQDESLSIKVAYSTTNEGEYPYWFGLGKGDFELWSEFENSVIAFILGDYSQRLVIPVQILKQNLEAAQLNPAGDGRYKFHISSRAAGYRFLEFPELDTRQFYDKSLFDQTRIARIRKYGPAGEGQEHRRLKLWLAEHPEEIGLRDIVAAKVEHVFPSGDSADLVFAHVSGDYTVVEVETSMPVPGAYQAIKYRALLCAEKRFPLNTKKVRAILVAWSFEDNLRDFCRNYDIEVREHKQIRK